MIKQLLKYIDFDDEVKEETLYFNLTAAELADIEVELGESLKEFIERIVQKDDDGNTFVKKENNGKVLNLFKMIISKAYGERTPEGRFVKTDDIRNSFLATEAYSQLFLRLITDPEECRKFISELAKVKVYTPEDHKQVTNA